MLRRQFERFFFFYVYRLQIAAFLQKKLENLNSIFFAGEMQRGITTFVRHVDVSTEGRQHFHGGVVSLRRSPVQRRMSVGVGGVDGAAGGKKRLSDGGPVLRGGVVEGRLSVAVAMVDVGAETNQAG